MATAVEPLPSSSEASNTNRLPKALRTWPQKLFKHGKGSSNGGVAHDIVAGAEGGPPAAGAVPKPEVEQRDPIQHVAGLNISANDPAAPASNQDTQQEARLQDEKQTEGTSTADANDDTLGGSGYLSPRKQEKQRQGEDQEDDPTDGAGGLSTWTRRSSLAPGANGTDEDEDEEQGTPEDKITFYHRDQPYFWLSNSSDHTVFLDGQRYPTAEHLFQSLKFLPHRADIAAKVRKASTPLDAIREARKNSTHVKRGWISQRQNVATMRTVLLLKFSQHSGLQKQLLQTNDAELIEDSPSDAFWGIGGSANGSDSGIRAGRNELGKALVRTRESLRQQVGISAGSGAKTV